MLNQDGTFSVVKEFQANKGTVYNVELYVANTTNADYGGTNRTVVWLTRP